MTVFRTYRRLSIPIDQLISPKRSYQRQDVKIPKYPTSRLRLARKNGVRPRINEINNKNNPPNH